MVYFSLTAKFEWLTLVRPAATARAHSRSRNAFGEKTLTSCLTRVGGPEISQELLTNTGGFTRGLIPEGSAYLSPKRFKKSSTPIPVQST